MSAIASSPDPAHDQATRRLVTGLVLSLLAHAVLLSLRFHVPEAGLAAVTKLMVRLAPTPAEAPPPVPAPVAIASSDLPQAAVVPPPKVSGFTVVPLRLQPLVNPSAPKSARRHTAKPAKRPELALKERVITQDINKDSEFTVPQPVLDELKADAISVREGTEQGAGTAAGKEDTSAMLGSDEKASQHVEQGTPPVLARQDESKEEKARQEAIAAAQAAEQQRAAEAMARHQAEEQARLAQQREDAQRAQKLADEEARRQAEQQQLAAQQQAEALRRQAEDAARTRQEELARQEAAQQRERILAEQKRVENEAKQQAQIAAQVERQRLADTQAREHEAEQARQLAERLAQRQVAEQARQQAERLAQQQAAEQVRQQAAEQARQQAERLAQQQAAEQARQQAERLAQQQAAEQARQQAERLAQQQAAEQARQQAERLAQQQAAEQARQQAQRMAEEQARADRERAVIEARRAAELAGNGAGAAGAGQGIAGGAGGAGKGSGGLAGVNLGSRARDMLRGLEVLGAPPPAARPVDSEQSPRRLVSNGAERDVPLRLYVDSFRQKIERNGLLNGAQLSASRVRVDPIVSVAIRSDGSVESVIIVRSSGHADIDAAVRRIVRLNERYGVFPPNVAVRFDVIEIRRIWTFAEGLRLMEEVR